MNIKQTQKPPSKEECRRLRSPKIAIGLACLVLAGAAFKPFSLTGFSIVCAAIGFSNLIHAALVPHQNKGAVTLLIQTGGAVCWGVFFSVMPIMEVLIAGAIIWLPALIYFERARAKQHGFLKGAAIRLATIVLIVFAASKAPLKYEDQKVIGPFSNTEMNLTSFKQELRQHGWRLVAPDSRLDKNVLLPPESLTLRQFIAFIDEQTDLDASIGYCGNSMSVLWGGYPMSKIVKVNSMATDTIVDPPETNQSPSS